jgi:hypothetical protein
VNDEIALFLTGLAFSVILFLLKVTVCATLGYFWVFLPLMLATGIFIFTTDGCDFF